MSRILTTVNTTTAALTSAAVSYDPQPENPGVYRVISNRAHHLLVTRDGTNATVSDLYVPADCAEFVRINPGEQLSVIRAAGETDGDIWFTPQRGDG